MIAFIVEILFFGFCGWLGHVTVKIVSLGKIDLDYGDSAESVITEWIGAGVFLAIAMVISFVINANRDRSSAELISPSRQVQYHTTQERYLLSESLLVIKANQANRAPGSSCSRGPQHPAYGIDFVHAVRLRRISHVAIATMALYRAVPIRLGAFAP